MRTRRGYILVQALIVIAGLLALMAMLAADQRASAQAVQDRLRQRRADAAGEAAVVRALAVLQDAHPGVVTLDDAWARLGDGGNEEFDLGDATFRMQIVDAGALVNVNSAPPEQLERLPLTQDQVHCLLDWREPKAQPRPDGAKDGYYNGLPTPYNAARGPLATTDELLLVKNWTGQTLYQAPPPTATGQLLTDSRGAALPLASLLTVDSGATNTRADGSPRVNLGKPGVTPTALTQAGISPDIAMRLASQAPFPSFSALLAVPGIPAEAQKQLLDVAGFSDEKRVEGKVNLNTASQATLRTLPSVTPALASAIVSRQPAGFHSLSELANVPGADPPRLAQIADHFTVGSDTWIVRAYGRSGGVGTAIEAVVGLRASRHLDPAQHDGDSHLVGLGRAAGHDRGRGGRRVRRSRITHTPLHVEWTPTWVRAVNVATRETAEAANLAALGPFLSGHGGLLVGIGRRAVFLKTVRLPKAAPEDLRRILGVQLGQLFPLPPDQLSFDFLQTADQTAEGCLTVVAAMRGEDLQRLQADLKQAGLAAVRTLPVALAAPAVAASAGRADALVLESAPDGLALDVVRDGATVFSRVVPAGSEPEGEARRTLAAAGVGPLPLVAVGEAGPPESLPAFGSALSLLHEAPPFSFRLAEDRSRDLTKRASERTRLAALLMLSALLLVVLVWADRQDAQAAAARRQAAHARQLATLRSVQNAETAKAQKAIAVQDVLDRAFTPAQPLGDIVSVVGDSLPRGAWLTGLGIERGRPLQLRGTATAPGAVPRIVLLLGANPRFRDVRLVFANSVTIGKVRAVEFDISAVCVGNLPLSAPEQAGGGGGAATQAGDAGAAGGGG